MPGGVNLDRGGRVRFGKVVPAVLVALGLVWFAGVNLLTTARIARSGYAGYVTLRDVDYTFASLRRVGVTLGLRDPRYLIPDIGATTYLADMRVIDLAGLADVHVAHSGFEPRLLER